MASGEDVQTAPHIARQTGLPEPTVSKVLKILASSCLVVSQRGARGGYRLKRRLDATSVGDVITAIEGPITVTSCVQSSQESCDVRSLCPMHGRWDRVNDVIRTALLAITVADLVQPELMMPNPTAIGAAAAAGA